MDDNGNCQGVSDESNKWKGCECIDDSLFDAPYTGLGSLADFDALQTLLDNAPTIQNTSDVSCGSNNLQNVPTEFEAQDKVISSTDLIYRLRQATCTNECALPEGIPENAVAITKTAIRHPARLQLQLTEVLKHGYIVRHRQLAMNGKNAGMPRKKVGSTATVTFQTLTCTSNQELHCIRTQQRLVEWH